MEVTIIAFQNSIGISSNLGVVLVLIAAVTNAVFFILYSAYVLVRYTIQNRSIKSGCFSLYSSSNDNNYWLFMASRTVIFSIMFRWSNNIGGSYTIQSKNGMHRTIVLKRTDIEAIYSRRYLSNIYDKLTDPKRV